MKSDIKEQYNKLGYAKGVKIKSLFGNTKGFILEAPYVQDSYLKVRVKTTFGEEMAFIIFDGINNKWAEKL